MLTSRVIITSPVTARPRTRSRRLDLGEEERNFRRYFDGAPVDSLSTDRNRITQGGS